MPLFSDKFSPRLSKPRKSIGNNNLIGRSSIGEENVDHLKEFKKLSIQLGDCLNLQFDGVKGEWKTDYPQDSGDKDDGQLHGDYREYYGDTDGNNDHPENENGDEYGKIRKRKSGINQEINNSTGVIVHSKNKELAKLKKANELLLEENRLLKLKVELLVDLVIEKGETTD